jgi:hypothetical protein
LLISIRTQEFKALRLRSKKWFWKSSTKQNSWTRAGAHVKKGESKTPLRNWARFLSSSHVKEEKDS